MTSTSSLPGSPEPAPVLARAVDLKREGWPISYATLVPGGRVSTRLRQSSALVDSPPWYYETMAFLNDDPGIAWHSWAYSSDAADRQHDLAVRWFSRSAS